MRRPTRAQLFRRRTVIGAGCLLALVLALGAWLLVTVDDGDDEVEAVTPAVAPSTTVAPTVPVPTSTAPPTTTSTGVFVASALGPGPVVGEGPLRTYRVEVEDGTGESVAAFAAEVERILSDPRGWSTAEGISLQRVDSPEAEMTVTLATPGTVDLLCHPLDTDGDVSCAKEGRAIINLRRWREGAEPSGLDLTRYQEYLVSHEMGHVLGHHHVECPGPGQLAPVMLQQTLGIGECLPNPWPSP